MKIHIKALTYLIVSIVFLMPQEVFPMDDNPPETPSKSPKELGMEEINFSMDNILKIGKLISLG